MIIDQTCRRIVGFQAVEAFYDYTAGLFFVFAFRFGFCHPAGVHGLAFDILFIVLLASLNVVSRGSECHPMFSGDSRFRGKQRSAKPMTGHFNKCFYFTLIILMQE